MRWSMLQNSLFPYQKNIEATARSLGMSAGMLPGWARKAAMSSFQPVPAPKKKKKKKSGAKAGKKAGAVKTVPEEARAAAAAGTPGTGQEPAEKASGAKRRPAAAETAGTGQASAEKASGAQERPAVGTPGTGQAPAEKVTGAQQASAEMLPGTAREQSADLPDLRTMMLWSEILGEPAARKRRRQAARRRGSMSGRTHRSAEDRPRSGGTEIFPEGQPAGRTSQKAGESECGAYGNQGNADRG